MISIEEREISIFLRRDQSNYFKLKLGIGVKLKRCDFDVHQILGIFCSDSCFSRSILEKVVSLS